MPTITVARTSRRRESAPCLADGCPSALWTTGLFANQNSATKLRNHFTLEQLTADFGLDDDAAQSAHLC